MPLSSFLFLILTSWAAITQQAGFSNPHYVVAYGTGQYESNTVWYIGQTKNVVYNISDLDGMGNYTIALWQQSITENGATAGPVVNSTTLPDVRDSFSWEVQLYDFDLSLSNVFFFWLFNGSSSNQGDTSIADVSSAYFNISSDDPPASSTSASSSTTATSKSSTATASASTTTSADATSATEASAATTTTAHGAESSSPFSSGSSGGGGGLSTGAGIGIGVGVGVAGFSAVACAALVVWYKRRKANAGARGSAFNELHELPPGSDPHTKPSGWFASQASSSCDAVPENSPNMAIYGGNQGGPTAQAVNYGYPAELHGRGVYGRAEMDADNTQR